MAASQFLTKWGNTMGNLHLVTGYAGQPHVTAADQGSLIEALIRGGQFVMEAGAIFAASIVSNNQIRVSDGELLMQGRHIKLTPGAYVDLTIENGAQGYLRNDLIVARYTRNPDNGIEECSLVVLKGTPVESNPSDPEYTTGNLNADGALQHDFPLYRVPLNGLNVGNLVALFKPQKSIYDYANGAFAPIGLTSGQVVVSTETELSARMREVYQDMPDGTAKIIRLSVSSGGLPLPGAVWFVTIYRTSAQYGYIDAVAYIDGGLRFTNIIYGGVWSGWKNRSASAAYVAPATVE